MPVFVPAATRIRQELATAIVQGEGMASGLIGKKILPDFPINRRTAHLITATLMDTLGLRIMDNRSIRAPGTKFERAVAKLGDSTITVTLRGMEIVVPNETELDLAGFLDVESFFCARFGQNSALTQEYLIQSSIFSTATFGSATGSGTAYTIANLGTAAVPGMNPVQDIIASIRRVKAKGEIPNTIVMSGLVWDRVRTCYNTLQFVRGTFNAITTVTLEAFTSALASWGIERVLIGEAYYNTAAEGVTPTLIQIWGTGYIWVGKAGKTFGTSTTAGEDISLEGMGVPTLQGVGASIYWEGYAPGGKIATDENQFTFDGGNYVESYPDLTIDSMVVRVKLSMQPYIGNANCGDLINPQYS